MHGCLPDSVAVEFFHLNIYKMSVCSTDNDTLFGEHESLALGIRHMLLCFSPY